MAILAGLGLTLVVVLSVFWSPSVGIAGLACAIVGMAIVGSGLVPSSWWVGEAPPSGARNSGGFAAVPQVRRMRATLDQVEEESRTSASLIAGAADEMKAPLRAITGFVDVLEDRAATHGDAQLLSDVRRARKAAEQIQRKFAQVMDLSRVASGRMPVFWERFEVGPVVEELRAVVEPQMARRGNGLTVDVDVRPGQVTTDRGKLKQIAITLLENAARHTGNGTIQLFIRRRQLRGEPHLIIEVNDDGPGIAGAQLTRLFDPRPPESGSAPLGLVVARHLCEVMGGTIEARSELGQGCRFRVALPDWQDRLATGTAGVIKVPAHMSKSVVLVDDDHAAIGQIRGLLSRAGIGVVTVFSVADAARLLEAATPRALIIEPDLDDGAGWELLRSFTKSRRHRGALTVVVTAGNERIRAETAGAHAVLRKPADASRLLEALNLSAVANPGANRTPAPMRAYRSN